MSGPVASALGDDKEGPACFEGTLGTAAAEAEAEAGDSSFLSVLNQTS